MFVHARLLRPNKGRILRCSRKSLCLAIATTFLSVLLAAPALAHASTPTPLSTKNRPYDLSINVRGDSDETGFAEKDSYSSTYVCFSSYSGAPCNMHVDGAHSSSGAGRYNCTIPTRGGNHVVVNKSMKGKEYEIHNNVKEYGYSHASVTVWNSYDERTVISGVWSPDCAGNYTDLN